MNFILNSYLQQIKNNDFKISRLFKFNLNFYRF